MEFKTSISCVHHRGGTHREIAKQLVLVVGNVAEETGVAIHTVVVLTYDADVKRIAGVGIGQEYKRIVYFQAVGAGGGERAVNSKITHAGDVTAHIEVASDASAACYSKCTGADAV